MGRRIIAISLGMSIVTFVSAQSWQKKHDNPYLKGKEVFIYGLSSNPWEQGWVPTQTVHYHYSARVYGEAGTGGFTWTAPFATLKENPNPPGYYDYTFVIQGTFIPIDSTYTHYVKYDEYWQWRFVESGGSVSLEKENMPPPAIETWELVVNEEI